MRGPEDFGAAFTALLEAAGVAPDGLVRLLKGEVSRSVLYDWKKGAHLPNDTRTLLRAVTLCLGLAGDGADLKGAPGDVAGWLGLLAEAKQTRDDQAESRRFPGVLGGVRPMRGAGGGSDLGPEDPVIVTVAMLRGLVDVNITGASAAGPWASGTVCEVTLEARTTRAVILEAIRPVIVERRYPRPACLTIRIGAALEVREFLTDLDADVPNLVARDVGFPFTISATDVERFQFKPTVTMMETEWRLEVDWLCGGIRGTTVIDDHGMPFRIYPTAALYDGRTPGVLNPGCGLRHEPDCSITDSGAHAEGLYRSVEELSRSGPDLDAACREVVTRLSGAPPLPPEDRASWPAYQVRTATAQMLLSLLPGSTVGSGEPDGLRTALLDILQYLLHSGRWLLGATLARAILDDWAESLGPDHLDSLSAAHRLGSFLVSGAGTHEESRKCLEETHRRRRDVLGGDHPDTLMTAGNLAVVLLKLGKYDLATGLAEETLLARQRVLGPEHPHTRMSLLILADIEQARNRHGEIDGR